MKSISLLVLSVVLMAGIVSAATTISSSITTGGTLTVTGTSTLMGNVGIATSSPSAVLGLEGGIGVSSSHLYLAANGNVGIGTTSPTSKLVLETSGATINPNIFFNKSTYSIPNYSAALSSVGLTATSSTFMIISTASNASGGGAFYGFTKVGTNNGLPLVFTGHHGGTSPTTPTIRFDAWKHDGGSSRTAIADNETIASFTNGGTTRFSVLGGGNVGIGSTTPTVSLQVATSTSNATTSIEIGKTGQNKGSCLVLYDDAGTVQYVSIHAGALVISATSCK